MTTRVKESHNYNHIATATTTTVLSGIGTLVSLVLNETTAGTVTIYDNTTASGAVIGIIAAVTPAQTLNYNIGVKTGITIVTAGADDITVVYNKG